MRACQPKDSKRREWRSVWGRGREREKERTHTGEKEREKVLWLLLLYVFSSTWACPMQIGLSQECCLFYLKSSLWSSDLPLAFLCSLFMGFSLPCLLATAILDSFSLFYLPNIPSLKRWEAQFFGNRGFEVFLATYCWTGMARGIGPPPLASLKLQSPYSGVRLRVCDIFRGRL